jgi:hypothetical protein
METDQPDSHPGARAMETDQPDSNPGTRVMDTDQPNSHPDARVMETDPPDSNPGTRVMETDQPDSHPGARILEPDQPGSNSGARVMDTDQPDSHPGASVLELARSRVLGLAGSRVLGGVAAAALFAVAVGGYLIYQNSGPSEVSSELQQTPASLSPGTEGTAAQGAAAQGTAPGASADAASNWNSQPVAATTNAPTENPPNQGSQIPPPSINSWRAGIQQGPADGRPARTNGGNATEAAARPPTNAQSKPTSLPTNDSAYVQKSRANIRAEPSVDARLVGQVSKGDKLTVVSRAGKWTQVESGATRGWISGNLLGPRLP